MSQEDGVKSYFKSKIKKLENENTQLKNELLCLTEDKNKNMVEYYLRLRSDLINEIESLKQSLEYAQMNFDSEKETLKKEIENLSAKLLEATKEKNSLKTEMLSKQNQKIDSPKNINTISEQNVATESNTIAANTLRNINVNTITNTISSDNEEEEKQLQVQSIKRAKTMANNVPDAKEEKIQSLEEQIRNLQIQLTQSDFVIKDKTDKITKLQNELLQHEEKSNFEIDNWKTRYNSILTANKSLCAKYDSLLEEKIKNYKFSMESNKYDLEKKIMHLEQVLSHKEKELNSLVESSGDLVNAKDVNINELKNQLKNQQSNYEIMFKMYNEHIQKMTTNLNNMKKLYFTRETEFINITNYYINMVNEYSKPMKDSDDIRNKIETQFKIQSEEILNLHKQIEELTKELNIATNDNMDYKPKTRMKLTQTIKQYDEKIAKIVEVHNNLADKLKVLTDFSTKLDEKLNLFNTIIEDNKSLVEKNNVLECKLKMNGNDGSTKEILLLKEKVFKLEKENSVKSSLIKEYDEMFKNFDAKASTSYDEVALKLKGEISRLNSQVLNLTKCKDNIENFYQNELKTLLSKLTELHERNDDLVNTIKKMENDYTGKKETILNLWMLEFKEFKENLLCVENIQSIVNNFNIAGSELTKHKEYLCNEELFMLRQEIKSKDDSIEKLKSEHKKEIEQNEQIISNYKTTIDNKVKMYNTLIENKSKELDALKKDKEYRDNFNKKKEELNDKEMENWEEQRKELEKISADQMDLKQGEVKHLKNEIEHLEAEIEKMRTEHDEKYSQALTMFEEQIKLVKDREDFTIQQLENLQEQFDAYKEEKERIIKVLKMENEQLNNLNLLLGKKQKM